MLMTARINKCLLWSTDITFADSDNHVHLITSCLNRGDFFCVYEHLVAQIKVLTDINKSHLVE
jgi:hypothetical protein